MVWFNDKNASSVIKTARVMALSVVQFEIPRDPSEFVVDVDGHPGIHHIDTDNAQSVRLAIEVAESVFEED